MPLPLFWCECAADFQMLNSSPDVQLPVIQGLLVLQHSCGDLAESYLEHSCPVARKNVG